MVNHEKYNSWFNLSDEDLLLVCDKEPQAFEVLLDRYRDKFINKSRQILANQEDAEDASQEALVSLFLYRKHFYTKTGASFSSWAYKILINKCFTIYRRKKQDKSHSLPLSAEMEKMLIDHQSTLDQERLIDQNEIFSYLSRLPNKTGNLIRKTLTGFSYRELAQEEKVSEATIRSRVSRAKKEINRLLGLSNNQI